MRTPFTNLLTGMLMLAAILMVWSRAAQPDTVLIEQAIELRVSQVVDLARGDIGRLVVRRCGSCRPELFTVDADTRYETSGDDRLARQDFLAAARADRDAMLVLFHPTGQTRVSRLRLYRQGSGED